MDVCLVDKETIDGTMIHVYLLIGIRIYLTMQRDGIGSLIHLSKVMAV